ncbi:glycosyltransferase family 1 protein [Moritella sp. Urea-trap-13]|uniref:glycosyltransferase family 1 protein n=1 Tax=Moritella sp. Urea-trap-13 TaxID=2058327 RepID=UPI000C33EAF9|nr:glycosyltransferase family 1 protein [Moritella sp. Urea-trap-13]PKH05321.1 hypothetical protein CXF93_18720 [Moritella sp. Urea-trap-13]
MNNSKVLLLSINSPSELTGGGHYFRTLIDGYSKNVETLTVIGKSDGNSTRNTKNVKYKTFDKSLTSDFFSRVLLSPSFLFFYILSLIKYIKISDVIAIHSSRLGLIVGFVRLFFPNKKIITHFDNNESKLLFSRLKKPQANYRYFIAVVDFLLIQLSERLSLKLSHKLTFITKNDASSFSCSDVYIIPICFDNINFSKEMDAGYVLFTASFDFEPNLLALSDYIKTAVNNPSMKFIAAGRQLCNVNCKIPDNMVFCSDPSMNEMELLFKEAKFYISCVNVGSGMKTKIAEAMKYQIPIFATSHSLIGYEDVKDKSFIFEYSTIEDINSDTFDILSARVNKKEINDDYVNYYSYFRVNEIISLVLSDL